MDLYNYALMQFELSRLTFEEAAKKLLKMDSLIRRKIDDGTIDVMRILTSRSI